jgi:plasmid stabilization system protein ParE
LRIVWSPLAIERAHEAAKYIARDKPKAARSWLEGVFEAVDRLEAFPESGRMVPEIGLPEYREIARLMRGPVVGYPSAARIAQRAGAIPELLRLAGLKVRIPGLEILALEHLAGRDGKSVDAVLARELLDVVSAHSDYLATAIPGFTAALRWPQG